MAITSPATAKLPANNIAMVPNADNTYTNAPLSGTFAGAETVHIAASGATGVALVALPLDFDTSTEYVECTSEPGASSLTIPKAALAVAGRVLTLLSVATKQIVAGGYAVSAGIYMNAFTPDKLHPVVIQIN